MTNNIIDENENIHINRGDRLLIEYSIDNDGTDYIYVPDNLVDGFKIATNWSTYATQIKPISEL